MVLATLKPKTSPRFREIYLGFNFPYHSSGRRTNSPVLNKNMGEQEIPPFPGLRGSHGWTHIVRFQNLLSEELMGPCGAHLYRSSEDGAAHHHGIMR